MPAVPGTLTGFALYQPSAQQTPQVVISGMLMGGAFVLTGIALAAPSLSVTLQRGAFILTGFTLGGSVVPPPSGFAGGGVRPKRRIRNRQTFSREEPALTSKAVEIVEAKARALDELEQVEQLAMLYVLSEDEE